MAGRSAGRSRERSTPTADGAPLASNWFSWAQGKVRTYTDARGLTVTNSWDNLGRLTERAYPDQTTISNSYTKLQGSNCPGGTVLLDRARFKDRLGNWTSFSYNSLAFLTTVTNALTNVTRYEWCDCGYLENMTEPLTNVTSFAHDLQGCLTNVVYPGAGQISRAPGVTVRQFGQLLHGHSCARECRLLGARGAPVPCLRELRSLLCSRGFLPSHAAGNAGNDNQNHHEQDCATHDLSLPRACSTFLMRVSERGSFAPGMPEGAGYSWSIRTTRFVIRSSNRMMGDSQENDDISV
jgi:YD repeat-containing protein